MALRASEHTEVVIVEGGEHARQVGYQVHIPKEGRRMLTIPIKVTKPGLARFQVRSPTHYRGPASPACHECAVIDRCVP
jgi:hypothetical protein